MIINGKTRTCGLFGNPVEHTLSPVIHNTLADLLQINMVYVPFLVQSEAIEEAVKGAFALNLLGSNVTVPHKTSVIPYLAQMDDLARRIGAVNTLVRVENGFKGYNTDMKGLLRAMQSEQVEIRDESVLLLGAGGAARAVAFLCAYEGAKEILIANRTLSKAEDIAKEVNASFGKELVSFSTLDAVADCITDSVLAIQCTSVGLFPCMDEVVTQDERLFKKIHTGVDLIYNPYETKFMRLVREHDGFAMNGLKMLLYQGIIAFELWNQVSVSDEQANVVLREMKKEMGIEQ